MWGSGLGYWGLAFFFYFFFPLCGVFHGKEKKLSLSQWGERRRHWFGLGKQNSSNLHTLETRVWFPVSVVPRSTNLWGFSAQQMQTIYVSVTALTESGSFSTTVTAPLFHKGFRNSVSSQCFSPSSDKKNTGCRAVTDRQMWVCLSAALSHIQPCTLRHTVSVGLSGLPPTLSTVLVNNKTPKLEMHVSPSTETKPQPT